MTRPSRLLIGCCLVAVVAASIVLTRQAYSGAYIFAGEANGVTIVTHPLGYLGSGTTLSISVGIDPTSANAASMSTSVQNIVNTINGLNPTTANLVTGGSNNIPTSFFDFESVALHELGHSMGLAHVNAASESGLSGSDQNYTKATDGIDNSFNLGIGGDGVRGSSDDIRGDDVNLFWFRMSDNNPFTIAPTVDSSTYSRNTASLPGGHTFAANGDRTVSGILGVPNTESIMQQGTGSDEAQRTLTHDDAATLRYGMAGLDETAGTSDDYTFTLTFAGMDAGADIVLDFDNTETGFAVATISGAFLGAHVRITSTGIFFNSGFNWFFNDVSNSCSFGITPTSVSIASGATSNTVAVTAGTGCAWTAVSNDAWITVTGGAGGTGNGTVNYSVAANGTGSQRVGTVTIAGETFTVTQAAACSFAISPTSVTVAAAGTSSTVAVTAGSGCAWTATSNDAWITVTSGATGTGDGTVGHSVAANTAAARTGTITIAGQTFTVTQAGGFTDYPLVAGTSTIKAVHFTELRTRINALRVGCSLSNFAFTDATLTAGSTTIQAVHVTELRTALGQAYVGCGQSAPTFTDATLTAGSTVIKAVHIAELRAAVIALE